MNKTDLISLLSERHEELSPRDSKILVNLILNSFTQAVASGDGAEIRGFGSFSRKTRAAYVGTHPKTLKKTAISKKYIPFFKAGKVFKEEARKMTKLKK